MHSGIFQKMELLWFWGVNQGFRFRFVSLITQGLFQFSFDNIHVFRKTRCIDLVTQVTLQPLEFHFSTFGTSSSDREITVFYGSPRTKISIQLNYTYLPCDIDTSNFKIGTFYAFLNQILNTQVECEDCSPKKMFDMHQHLLNRVST